MTDHRHGDHSTGRDPTDEGRSDDRGWDGAWPRTGRDQTVAGHPGLGQALGSLAAVGDRERRQLTSESMDRMARAAAQERLSRSPSAVEPASAGNRRPATRPLASRTEPITRATALELTDATGLRRHRRRPILALAAAALVVAIAGAALLSPPDQVVVTQEGAASGAPPPGEIDGRREGRPVLDLGESMATTLVPTPAPSAPPTEPARSTTGPPSSTDDRSSPASTPPSSSTTSPSNPPPTTGGNGGAIDRPSPNEPLRIEVGAAGAVALRLHDSTAEILDVMPAPGWEHTVVESRAGGIDVVLVDDLVQASLGVRSDPGRFLLEVDDGGTGRSRRTWISTYTIDESGVVRTTYNGDGLLTLEVRLADGWQHHITTSDQNRLMVHIVSPDRSGRTDQRIDAGPVTIDLLVTGP